MKFTISLLALITVYQSLLAAPFKTGYYYTSEGKKIEGLINSGELHFLLLAVNPAVYYLKKMKMQKQSN